jgi:nitrogen fixation/metabolism regulation signal transduction histidine kinase
LLVIAAALWLAALAALVYLAARITRPVRVLTQGLGKVAAGDLSVRVPAAGSDEIGAAMHAFNHMADALQQARDRLIHVTRLASWQALAHKMAHEVKNSLTPIRLTVEEIASRRGEADRKFLEQAVQIVVDEVQILERRVRAFSEFAAEPPVLPAEIDINALVEERVSLLRSAHPGVSYETELASERPVALADPDLIKGVLTNLLENAAQAAQSGGVVRARTVLDGARLYAEVHDSGPGLTAQARASLFEPSISFKKGGMGLGLSIAKRSALLCGGDIQVLEGELGGAGFRLVLPDARAGRSPRAAVAAPVGSASN